MSDTTATTLTPGPWQVDDCDADEVGYYVEDADEREIATVHDEDDARLIAAAPLMLQHLKGVLHHYDALNPEYKMRPWSDPALINEVRRIVTIVEGGAA